jgi:hypothetical protein
MHPIKHPRNVFVIAVVFIFIAVVYWAVPTIGHWHVDYAGTTMLVALGIAMSLMAYVLIAGSRE